jgi:hypothetical protein
MPRGGAAAASVNPPPQQPTGIHFNKQTKPLSETEITNHSLAAVGG